MKKLIAFLSCFFCITFVSAGPHYQSGTISNITSTKDGLRVKLDSGIPDNCEGTPYGWMLIKQEHTTMITVALAAWASGKKTGTFYTSGRENGTGYCLISQFDPSN